MKLRRTCRPLTDPLVERREDVENRHLPAEIPLVEWPSEYSFIHALKMAQREFLRQEVKAGGGVFELVCQPFESVLKNPIVIEREGRMLSRGHPLGCTGIGASPQRAHFPCEQRVVRDRDDATSRIAIRIAKRV